MTGLQDHPATGRTLDHQPTNKLILEDLAKSMGISRVYVIDPVKDNEQLERTIVESLALDELTVIINRRPCLLSAKKIKQYQKDTKVP